MKRPIISLAFIVLSLLTNAQPDYILFNGKIFTADEETLYVEALAVTQNKVSAIGKSIDLLKLSGAHTKKINLNGKTVTPGFNDAHFHHVAPYDGRHLMFPFQGPDAPGRKTVEDSISLVARNLPKGTWIFATLGEGIMNDRSLDRFALDRIAPDHPVWLSAFWGHVSIFNTAALQYAGVLDKQRESKAGYFELLPSTKTINGRVYDNAQYLSPSLDRLLNDNTFVTSLQQLSKEALRYGVTSIQNMCTSASPQKYSAMWQKAGLPIRFRLIKWADMDKSGKLNIPSTIHLPEVPLLTASGTKWMVEGTPVEKNAYFTRGYLDPPGWHGILYFSKEEIRKMLLNSVEENEQCMFHLSGDTLAQLVLSVMEEMPQVDWRKLRVRFEHASILSPEMIAKVKSLGVVVVVNPIHPGMGTGPSFLNPGSDQDLEPVKTLLDQGIPLAIGSDGPLNPFLNIMFAVLRRTQSISVEKAVIAYTKTSAYAEFTESNKGTLTPGQVADLVILSQDIFSVPPQQLPATHSLLTMVDGMVSYSTNEVVIDK